MTPDEARLFWRAVIVLAPAAILLGLATAEWGVFPIH